jgi:hypothetical protein
LTFRAKAKIVGNGPLREVSAVEDQAADVCRGAAHSKVAKIFPGSSGAWVFHLLPQVKWWTFNYWHNWFLKDH